MKIFLSALLLTICWYAKAQTNCVDSSSHIRYQSAFNDSFRIQKIILTKDSAEVAIGFFLQSFSSFSSTFFILKKNKSGTIEWFKKLSSAYLSSQSQFQNLAEAANGNIIIGGINAASSNKPFFFVILSSDGNLIVQKAFDIANTGLNLNSAFPIYISCITQYGQDSMLICITHPVIVGINEPHAITLMCISNSGMVGSDYTFVPPAVTYYSSYFGLCKIESNFIYLYGAAQFANTCVISSFDQPSYVFIKIDWLTKQVVDKKAFCSPLVGYSKYDGFPLLDESDNDNFQFSFLANDEITIAKAIWGLQIKGSDTLTNLFKISRFDKNFNHIKSEYISTDKRFGWWPKWNYYLTIDSFNNRRVYVSDYPNQQIDYAVGDSTGMFSIQKQILHTFTRGTWIRPQSDLSISDPGSFTSFNIITGDDDHTFIDNFRILARDTAMECFGKNFNFLTTKVAEVKPISWQGNFTSDQKPILTESINFTITDYYLQRNIICNIVHKCDILKFNATDTVCNLSQPLTVSVHKNPLCDGNINFRFDTSAVKSYWQLNDTTIRFIFNSNRTFKMYAQLSTCNELTDSIVIYSSLLPHTSNLGKDTVFCPGKTYLLNAGNDFLNYTWQDGSHNNTFSANVPGVYYVSTEDYCHRNYTDTIKIISKNFKIDLGKDTTICLNETIMLAVPSGYLNYVWKPQSNITYQNPNTVIASPKQNTLYSVEAEVFKGCQLYDSINIKIEPCPEFIYFPTAFTPNNDGLNDTFKPYYGGALEKYEIQIYNRWGGMVFSSKNKNEGWNGTYKGLSQNNGTFVWLCKYKYYGKEEKILKGTVNLIK